MTISILCGKCRKEAMDSKESMGERLIRFATMAVSDYCSDCKTLNDARQTRFASAA